MSHSLIQWKLYYEKTVDNVENKTESDTHTLETQYLLSVSQKEVLLLRLGIHVCQLVRCTNGEYTDDVLPHMFTEVMVSGVDVLDSGAQLGDSCEFQHA